METKITNENGAFVVHVRREFSTMEDAQRFVATVHFGGEKVDKRKMRPRAFDEFCEYLPDSTRTLKRAKCNICIKLHGHIAGVTEATFNLEWKVGDEHQAELKERENNEASRHLKAKVKTADGLKTVKELHEMYRQDPEKFAAAAPPPPHQPVMTTWDETIDLETAIEQGEELARAVGHIAWATAYAVIAMQEPVADGEPSPYGPLQINLEKHAKTVLAKHNVKLADVGYVSAKYNNSVIEQFLCELPRSEAVDLALHIYQKLWYQGVRKAVKNKGYFPYVLSRFKQARSAHEAVMNLVQTAFGEARFYPPWEPQPRSYTERILAVDAEDVCDSDE